LSSSRGPDGLCRKVRAPRLDSSLRGNKRKGAFLVSQDNMRCHGYSFHPTRLPELPYASPRTARLARAIAPLPPGRTLNIPTIRMIVPQAAGSSTDTLMRVLAAALSDELHQQIVVDDRPGGALTLGLDLAAKSAPDGYTLCMGPIGALAITSHLVVPLRYDVARDFQPIALVSRGQLLLAVSPTTPFHSVRELIDYAKQNPGKLLNASSSSGSPGHVGGELFKFMTGTQIVHVPYKGGASAINDLIAGRVQLMFESLNSIAPFARSGAVRPLAVSGDHRSPWISRSADYRRGRRPRLFRADLGWRHCSRRRAAGDHRHAQCRHQSRHPRSAGQGNARGIRRADRFRFQKMGRGDRARWHQIELAVTFPAPRLDPYCEHGKRPRLAARAK
jgi:Tripartite tricarboxylate transporter family receptor